MTSGHNMIKRDRSKSTKESDDITDEDEHHELLDLPPNERPSSWTLIKKCLRKRFYIPERIVLCVFAHMGFANIYMMRGNLSVALVPMTSNYTVLEGDRLVYKRDFDWDLKDQGILLSSFFYGYILTQIPGGYLAACFGGRRVFGIGVAGAAIVSLLTPVCIKLGFYVLVLARFLCGLSEGVTYPAIHAMWSCWAPPNERSRLATFAFSGAYFGTALCMVHFGKLSGLFGWESIFYISGLYALAWSILWALWGGETPQGDRMISNSEREYIIEAIGTPHKYKTDITVPWTRIFLSPRVWAINICHFAANWGFYTLLTELPTFLTSALHYDLEETSTISAIPFFAMGCTTILGGWVTDFIILRLLSITNARKVVIFITFMLQMLFFFIIGKATSPDKVWPFFIGILAACGVSWSGFSVNHLDIAPDYASVLLGISNMVGTVPGIISPLITGFIVEQKEDLASWSVVFLIAGYLYLFAACFYTLLGSAECQDWANSSETAKLTGGEHIAVTNIESGSE